LSVKIVNPLKTNKMANCPNCKIRLSCGCQRRTATDKAIVCTNCITAYEVKIKQQPKKP